MRSIPFLLLAVFPALLMAQSKIFVIQGTIKNSGETSKVYLMLIDSRQKDSANISNGKFKFEGRVPNPGELGVIYLKPATKKQPADVASFYAEEGTIRIDATLGSLKDAIVYGTPTNNDFNTIKLNNKELIANYLQTHEKLKKSSANYDAAKAKLYADRIEVLKKKIDLVTENFITTHPNSMASVYLLQSLVNSRDSKQLTTFFNGLSTQLKVSKAGLRIQSEIARKIRGIQIGELAPDFALKTTKGKSLQLSSLRGKYVMLDFWASWCGPCRLENPNLIKFYNLYKDRNFIILGVSADGDKNKWLNAVKKDGLTWPNVIVSHTDKKNNALALYHISSWPTSFLIDPQGRVIAKNLRGDELGLKLAGLLSKN